MYIQLGSIRISFRSTASAPSSHTIIKTPKPCRFPLSTAAYIHPRRTSSAQHSRRHGACNNACVVALCTIPTAMHVIAIVKKVSQASSRCVYENNNIVDVVLLPTARRSQHCITLTVQTKRVRQVSKATVEGTLRWQVVQIRPLSSSGVIGGSLRIRWQCMRRFVYS